MTKSNQNNTKGDKMQPNKLIIEKLDQGYLLKYGTLNSDNPESFKYTALETEKKLMKQLKIAIKELKSPRESMTKIVQEEVKKEDE